MSVDLHGFSLASLAGSGGSTVDFAQLYQGELRVYRSWVGSTASFTPCTGYSYGVARSCGFRSAGYGTCVPGASVALNSLTGGCSSSCTGDPVMRVCAGVNGCEHGSSTVLAEGDDSCGSLCPSVAFTCPSSGSFTVMTGPYSTWNPGYADTLACWGGSYPQFNWIQGGSSVAGMTIDGIEADGTHLPMQIVSAVEETSGYKALVGPGSTWRYELKYTDTNHNLAELCGPDDSQLGGQGDNLPVGIPVAGWWNADGGRVDDPDRITFACRKGVISKCYRWGYRPWDWALADGGTWVSLKDYHQACTRMARADYCGDGHSYTRYGTLIDAWDHLAPPQQSRVVSSGMPFEAGWNTEGAVCLSHTRWNDAPAGFVYTCPKLAPNGPGSEKYCDEDNQTFPDLSRAILFNESNNNIADGGVGP